jgi:hypothetical protein
VCGHSSRRRVTANAHQRPTRRFRRHPEPSERIGPMRSAAWFPACASLPIWSCSVWGLPCLRRYRRSGALLPHLFTLTRLALGQSGGMFSVALAVHEPSRPRPGRYPAHRPAEFGLSSPGLSRQRPPGPPASSQFIAKALLSEDCSRQRRANPLNLPVAGRHPFTDGNHPSGFPPQPRMGYAPFHRISQIARRVG